MYLSKCLIQIIDSKRNTYFTINYDFSTKLLKNLSTASQYVTIFYSKISSCVEREYNNVRIPTYK